MAFEAPIPLPGPLASTALLHLTCILSLSLPPFPLRAALFVPPIILLAIATHASPTDPTNPQLTYAIGSLWPLYLSTLSQHLLLPASPETHLHLRTDKPGDAATWGFSLRKVLWSTKLFLDQRGVGWNFRVKGVAPAPGKKKIGRWEFVLERAVWGAVLAVAYDFCHEFVVTGYKIPDARGGGGGGYVSAREGGFIRRFAIAVVNFAGIELNHVFCSVLVVAVGLYEPEDWPPLFGPLTSITSIRNFWGTFWHQTIRRTLTLLSTSPFVPLPKTYATAITLSFLTSGLFHALPLLVMPPFSRSTIPYGILAFYFLQPLGILLESLFSSAFHKGKSTAWTRTAGRIWTALWFNYTLPLFWNDMFAVGMMDGNSLLVSVAGVVRRWWYNAHN
ncbi:hypothetical protein L873DRAFT_1843512 [Choiromyces venosus 120613-1]|uniref:Wax synthase domain-containing protein n=1 Tax=Choiromyces venosus 120613-1 TaxID=1336337 RepID=A0A3N4JMZ8_9PEZI|nr:hypothetical protein L873DRAFT_1843512 [Choiromyces venosus 120613-1]